MVVGEVGLWESSAPHKFRSRRFAPFFHSNRHTLNSSSSQMLSSSMASSRLNQGILELRLAQLLDKREYPKTICPSEVPRGLNAQELQELDASSWRDLMDLTRMLVWAMRDRGEVEILQRGQVLDDQLRLEDVKGPIRVRKKRNGAHDVLVEQVCTRVTPSAWQDDTAN